MTVLRKYLAIVVLGALALTGLYACGGETPPATPVPPTATPAPPPPTDTAVLPSPTMAAANSGSSGSTTGASGPAVDLVKQSTQAMNDIKTVHLSMTIGSNVGTGTTITAEGDAERPGKSRLTMQSPMGSIDTINIDKDVYMRLAGQTTYMQSPGGANPADSFGSVTDPASLAGFTQIMESANVVGDEKVDGADTTHISFTYDQDKAMAMLSAASGTPAPTEVASLGKAKGDMWIDKSTHFIRRFKFTTALPAAGGMGAAPGTNSTPGVPGEATIEVNYSKFNEPISPPIEKPADVATPGAGMPPVPGGAMPPIPGGAMPGLTPTP
ncbi:MAG: LppX_LprAFG lipoprotein [Chloroflexia bacterium]